MKDKIFTKGYANQYDNLYNEKNYDEECDILETLFNRYSKTSVKKILDLGCGTGNHSFPLSKRGYKITGVDLSKEMLSLAEKKNNNKKQPTNKPVFIQGDVRDFDCEQTFDVVLMMFAVIGYQLTNEDIKSTLNTVRKHLKPGGLFICDFWYGPAVLNIGPTDRIKKIKLKDSEIMRISSGELDIDHHICKVNFDVWNFKNGKIISKTKEEHNMRFFFPMELKYYLTESEFILKELCSFPDIDIFASKNEWNALACAQAK